jgi:hypothetical protein
MKLKLKVDQIMSTRRRVIEELFYYYDSQYFEDVIIPMSKQEFEDILISLAETQTRDEWQSFGDIKFTLFEGSLEIDYPCRFMSEVQDSIYEAYLKELEAYLKELRECQLLL